MTAALPESVEVPMHILQQAVAALDAAGKQRLLVGMTRENVQAITRAQTSAIVLQAHVQRAINQAVAA